MSYQSHIDRPVVSQHPSRPRAPGTTLARHARLEVLEAADLRQVLLGRDVLEHAVLTKHLLLDLDDEVDVPGVERVVAQYRPRDRALGLEGREAAQPVHQAVEVSG